MVQLAWIEATTHVMVELADTTAIDRYLWFNDCTFLAESVNDSLNMASALTIPSGTAQGYILITGKSSIHGIADWDSDNRGKIFNGVAAPAASGAGGLGTEQ